MYIIDIFDFPNTLCETRLLADVIAKQVSLYLKA